eukprot:748724-Hanusia_phi.AAC.1
MSLSERLDFSINESGAGNSGPYHSYAVAASDPTLRRRKFRGGSASRTASPSRLRGRAPLSRASRRLTGRRVPASCCAA